MLSNPPPPVEKHSHMKDIQDINIDKIFAMYIEYEK